GLQLGLERADLVEKQRAALGQLEAAELALIGSGERALLVAEQLGLDQRVRERGRIDGHERLVTARALPMNGAGDQLLAGAALAGDDDGGGRPRHLRDETVELLHLGVLADQLVEVVLPRQFRAEEGHLALERALLEGAPDQREQV